MNWLDYREKLGIGFSDEKKVKYFTVKMFNFLNAIADDYQSGCITSKEYLRYCDTVGVSANRNILDSYQSKDRFRDVIAVLHRYENHLPSFIAHYMALVNVTDESRYGDWKQEQFLGLLKQLLYESKIQFELINDPDGWFLFPKGADGLDTALVSQPLSWLSAYPKAHTAYVKALKEYSEATPDNASDIADKFRKTLETFLREFFGNNAPLEKNKVEYGRYLKSQGIPAEITGNMETLLQAYANFMNGYAKHQDATSLNVLEYLMYQTGNIIRLLITLKCEEGKDKV